MNEIKKNTLVFPVKGSQVLLGMKKRGFGAGWWNGFGGKLENGETFDGGAVRETKEEVGLAVSNLKLVARLLFYFGDKPDIACKVYTTENFEGEVTETEEMRPQWFFKDGLPYDEMWPADRRWLPAALQIDRPHEAIAAQIYFDSQDDKKFVRLKYTDTSTINDYFLEV